jgi:hypothetical protein
VHFCNRKAEQLEIMNLLYQSVLIWRWVVSIEQWQQLQADNAAEALEFADATKRAMEAQARMLREAVANSRFCGKECRELLAIFCRWGSSVQNRHIVRDWKQFHSSFVKQEAVCAVRRDLLAIVRCWSSFVRNRHNVCQWRELHSSTVMQEAVRSVLQQWCLAAQYNRKSGRFGLLLLVLDVFMTWWRNLMFRKMERWHAQDLVEAAGYVAAEERLCDWINCHSSDMSVSLLQLVLTKWARATDHAKRGVLETKRGVLEQKCSKLGVWLRSHAAWAATAEKLSLMGMALAAWAQVRRHSLQAAFVHRRLLAKAYRFAARWVNLEEASLCIVVLAAWCKSAKIAETQRKQLGALAHAESVSQRLQNSSLRVIDLHRRSFMANVVRSWSVLRLQYQKVEVLVGQDAVVVGHETISAQMREVAIQRDRAVHAEGIVEARLMDVAHAEVRLRHARAEARQQIEEFQMTLYAQGLELGLRRMTASVQRAFMAWNGLLQISAACLALNRQNLLRTSIYDNACGVFDRVCTLRPACVAWSLHTKYIQKHSRLAKEVSEVMTRHSILSGAFHAWFAEVQSRRAKQWLDTLESGQVVALQTVCRQAAMLQACENMSRARAAHWSQLAALRLWSWMLWGSAIRRRHRKRDLLASAAFAAARRRNICTVIMSRWFTKASIQSELRFRANSLGAKRIGDSTWQNIAFVFIWWHAKVDIAKRSGEITQESCRHTEELAYITGSTQQETLLRLWRLHEEIAQASEQISERITAEAVAAGEERIAKLMKEIELLSSDARTAQKALEEVTEELDQTREECERQAHNVQMVTATAFDLEAVLERARLAAESSAQAEIRRFEMAKELEELRFVAARQSRQVHEFATENHRLVHVHTTDTADMHKAYREQLRRTESATMQALDLAKEVQRLQREGIQLRAITFGMPEMPTFSGTSSTIQVPTARNVPTARSPVRNPRTQFFDMVAAEGEVNTESVRSIPEYPLRTSLRSPHASDRYSSRILHASEESLLSLHVAGMRERVHHCCDSLFRRLHHRTCVPLLVVFGLWRASGLAALTRKHTQQRLAQLRTGLRISLVFALWSWAAIAHATSSRCKVHTLRLALYWVAMIRAAREDQTCSICFSSWRLAVLKQLCPSSAESLQSLKAQHQMQVLELEEARALALQQAAVAEMNCAEMQERSDKQLADDEEVLRLVRIIDTQLQCAGHELDPSSASPAIASSPDRATKAFVQ